jgi:hypothetical protein
VSAGLNAALAEWEAGPVALRRLRRGLPPRLSLAVDEAAGDLQRELTRRLGPSYTLDDLYGLYVDAEDWGRIVVQRALAPQSRPELVAPLIDTTFQRAVSGARPA